MKNQVFLVKTNGHDIYASLKRLIGMLDLPDKIQQNKIGIKINMCDYRRRETGVTSDPLVLEPLLRILRERYPEIRIFFFEHDATGTVADNLFLWLGFEDIANKYDVEFINLAKEKWTVVPVDGLHFKELQVPQILMDSLIINHPKLKTHGRTKITCALKNMYACYQIKEKIKYHSFLDEAIVDINLPLKSHYIIVDGNLCLEGNRGPTQGYPKKVGIFLGGSNVVSVDAFCAKLMGFHPRLVRHIRLSAARGLGSMNYQLESELSRNEIQQIHFKFSLGKYYLMEILRKVVKN